MVQTSFRLWVTHALKMERGWTQRSCGRCSLVWKPVQQVGTPLVSSSFFKIYLKKNKNPPSCMMKNEVFSHKFVIRKLKKSLSFLFKHMGSCGVCVDKGFFSTPDIPHFISLKSFVTLLLIPTQIYCTPTTTTPLYSLLFSPHPYSTLFLGPRSYCCSYGAVSLGCSWGWRDINSAWRNNVQLNGEKRI